MTQTTDALLEPRTYTRSDYAALRAFVQRIPLSRISDLYYLDDSPQTQGPGGLERFMLAMRDDLIERAVARHPASADFLRKARSGGELTAKALALICEIAEAKQTPPRGPDPLSMWFRPKVTTCLKAAGPQSLQELVHLINRRGHGWWRPIRRIGAGKAQVIVAFLQRHAVSIGSPLNDDVLNPPKGGTAVVDVGPLAGIRMSPILAGLGSNRNFQQCQIHAENDLDAARAYLMTFEGHSPATLASYGQNLARMLFWCGEIAHKSVTELGLEDIEAYKAFLADPPSDLVGTRAPRGSVRWRPFAGPLSVSSQQFAFRAAKAFLQWLTDVRYLAFNPAAAARSPQDRRLREQYTDKALSEVLWTKLTSYLMQHLDREADPQFRIVVSAILLAGDSGLRRQEVAAAERGNLHYRNGIWHLAVLGKGNKWRVVTVSRRAVDALKFHWEDRGKDFMRDDMEGFLIAPIHRAPTTASQARADDAGYRPLDLARAVSRAMKRMAQDERVGLSGQERETLTKRTFHAFRHTLATHAIAKGVSLKTVQNLLGHARLTTTSVYLQLEQQKMNEEMAAFYRGQGASIM